MNEIAIKPMETDAETEGKIGEIQTVPDRHR